MTATFIPDAVEAMVALGRHAEAEPLIEALEHNGRRLDRSWMLAVGARCRSMWLAARGDVAAATADCGARDGRARSAADAVRTRPHPAPARPAAATSTPEGAATATLREALQAFEAMGAPLWADRARAELARAKVAPTPRRRRSPRPSSGWPSWRHPGMTNRDVAAALFISPKTVEANLARIYRKLGIKSRAELGRVIGDL